MFNMIYKNCKNDLFKTICVAITLFIDRKVNYNKDRVMHIYIVVSQSIITVIKEQ